MSKASQKKTKDKETRKVIDKFTLKTWYKVFEPEMFGNNIITETPSAEPNKVIGRTLSTTLMDLTDDFKKMHVKIIFKISEVKGDNAYSTFYGHEYTRDYIRSIIRRRRTRIDGIFNITSKDGAKLRTSIIALTPFRCKTSHEHGIRKEMYDVVTKKALKLPFDKLVKEIVSGKLATEVYKRAKTIHPLQNVDIWKSKVLNLPTMKLTEEMEKEPPKENTEELEKAKLKEEQKQAIKS